MSSLISTEQLQHSINHPGANRIGVQAQLIINYYTQDRLNIAQQDMTNMK